MSKLLKMIGLFLQKLQKSPIKERMRGEGVYSTSAVLYTMGWLRLVGFLKLQVFFAEEPYKKDDILQKRPVILRSLLIVATPYYDCKDICRRAWIHARVCT